MFYKCAPLYTAINIHTQDYIWLFTGNFRDFQGYF